MFGCRNVRRFCRYLSGSSANIPGGGLGSEPGRNRELARRIWLERVPDRATEREKVNTTHAQRVPGFLPSLCLTEVSPPDHSVDIASSIWDPARVRLWLSLPEPGGQAALVGRNALYPGAEDPR